MKKKVSIYFLVIVICISVCGCAQNGEIIHGTDGQTVPESMVPALPLQLAVESIVSFYEVSKTSPKDAFNRYCHYEHSENYDLAMQYCTKTLEYEILSVKQLSDKLWSVEIFAKTEQVKLGLYTMQFVGIVDGEYKVMISSIEIPFDLKDGVEIEEYVPHGPGIVDPGDVQFG